MILGPTKTCLAFWRKLFTKTEKERAAMKAKVKKSDLEGDLGSDLDLGVRKERQASWVKPNPEGVTFRYCSSPTRKTSRTNFK